MGKKKRSGKTGLRNMVHAMSLNTHYGTGVVEAGKDKEKRRNGRKAMEERKMMKKWEGGIDGK